METKRYDLGAVKDEELKFAVIVTKYNDKFVYCRHKKRDTWEIPGGHREKNENIDDTAARELQEETGAEVFKIKPICDYLCDYSSDGKEDKSYGRVFYAEVDEMGQLPNFEIEEIKLFDSIPNNLTYPKIQPFLLEWVLDEINKKENYIKDLSISDMMSLSYQLWEKNKEKWSPMEAKYGRSFILYMIEEIGEVIAIIKKKGEDEIMNNQAVRERFVEELGDVLMYYIDVLNRFKITPEEFSNIYMKKFASNMERDYEAQYKKLI